MFLIRTKFQRTMQSNVKTLQQISLKNILIVFSLFADQSRAIQCFGCGVTADVIQNNHRHRAIPPCSNFDGSSKFIMDCPFSTMCLRTVHTMYLINGRKLRTTTLSCAQQKQSKHVLRNNTWEEQYSVVEVYPEDCITMATKMHCYCRGHLCNVALKNVAATNIIFLIALSVSLLF